MFQYFWQLTNIKITNKKSNIKIKIVKHSFSVGNITRYSGLNTVGKFINIQGIMRDLNKMCY